MKRQPPALDPETTERLLLALGEHLEDAGAHLELVICGGAALQVIGLISRPTRDVDVLAIADGNYRSADPFPDVLTLAAGLVAQAYELDADWLNAGPTSLLRWGLPGGFTDRLITRQYASLTAHFAGRLDQVCFKLYAFADLGGGRHELDLRALSPTHEELTFAAAWVRTQDPSEGFSQMLQGALDYLEGGGADAD